MNPETFFENFELFANAPNGVQKLREMILQLAVQGKLVPQDPIDEPASELLKKIRAEKEHLLMEKKIKRVKPSPSITENEIPYKLPEEWQWVRLDSICSYIQRGKGPKYVEHSDIPVIAQKCIQWDGFHIERARFIDPSSLNKYTEERFLRTGDLLCNSTGTGTLGRINVYIHEDNPFEHVVADSHVTVIRSINLNSKYLYIFLASPFVQNDIENRASGTTKQTELNISTIRNQIIPLPPVPEQKRIVAKVEQLIEVCDELESCRQRREKERVALNNSFLNELLSAESHDDFQKHWQRIYENFDLLYDNSENVSRLRRMILELAVRGKLVPQNSDDEPASELLKKIRAEKERLVKENKIKRAKPLQSVAGEKIPYILPNGWEWVCLDEISSTVQYGYTASADPLFEDVKFLRITDIQNGHVNWSNVPGCRIDEKAIDRYKLNNGDLLIARTGGTIGKSFLIYNVPLQSIFASYLIRIVPSSFMFPKYMKYFLESPLYWMQLYAESKGTGQPNVNGTALRSLLFPLPSEQEQKRIVAKVDQFMSLCDELDSLIKHAQSHTEKITEEAVAEVTGI